MKEMEGWWCPDIMKGPAGYVLRSQELNRHISRAKKRRACVQAGGHIGIYPKALAAVFERVYTFEPEERNFACLARNAALPNVYAVRGFLGDTHGGRSLRVHSKSSGGHSVGEAGPIPTWKVDDLALPDLDALFIDVEGFEWWALRGGLRTIGKCKPLLVLEENKKLEGRGRKYGDLERLVAPLGYRLVDRVGEDIVLEC
jgi:FkbM family methyltransferase